MSRCEGAPPSNAPPSTPNASVHVSRSASTSTARNGRNRQGFRARVGSKMYSYHCIASANCWPALSAFAMSSGAWKNASQ